VNFRLEYGSKYAGFSYALSFLLFSHQEAAILDSFGNSVNFSSQEALSTL
jgi:hypothetical protein